MMNSKKHIPKITVILLLVIGLLLIFLAARHITLSQKDEWKELKTLLRQREYIIDGIRDGNRIYTLISREGRTDYADLLAVFEQSDSQSADKPVDKPADRPANQHWERVYENDFGGLKPWKIELADIDGDGMKEVLTAVRKTTHFDPEEKNRLFIFNYEDKKLSKKWTGSLTNGIWEDFIVDDLLPIPGNELIFIVQDGSQEEHLSIYYWFDFGFQKLADSFSYKNIGKVSITGENGIQISYDKGRTAALTVKDGKIIEAVPEQ